MKKYFAAAQSWLFVLIFLLSACQPAPAGTRFRVLAAESFLADIVQNVAGDRVVVESLIPSGLDPHSFEPTPRDVIRVAESSVLIVNGAGFEGWLQNVIDNAGGQHLVVEAAAGLQSRSAREGEQASMSPEEKARAFCADLSGRSPTGSFQAGADALNAVEPGGIQAQVNGQQHENELISLNLAPKGDAFGGFIKLKVEVKGEMMTAAGPGSVKVTGPDGSIQKAESVSAVECSGLAQLMVFDLDPGDYMIELDGYKTAQSPFLAGPAGEHHHTQGDPHFWLDPVSVYKYVENIRAGLSRADPEGQAVYARNAELYLARLKELDQYINDQVRVIPTEHRLIVTNHESFGYFADRYGFKIIGTIIPSVSSDASPSAHQLARLVDRIKATQARAVFLETGANPQLAEQLAHETGIKVVTDLFTHSITEPGGKAPTYIDMMKYNARVIVEALK